MIEKQTLPISFAQGLDTKTDPFQIAFDNFLILENTIFTKGKLLVKRNGYQELSTLPSSAATHLTTLNGNLTAIGNSILAYNSSNESWVSRGTFHPLELDTLPLIRNNINQTQCDSAVSQSGLICTAYSEINAGVFDYRYVIADSVTGQNVVVPSFILVTTGAVAGSPRVFIVGNYFVIVFTTLISATYHLQYISISMSNLSAVTTNADLAASYIPSNGLSWDAVSLNSKLYVIYNTTSGGQSLKITYITEANLAAGLGPVVATTFSGAKANLMSLTADTTNASQPIVYSAFYRNDLATTYFLATDQNLNTIIPPTSALATSALNVTAVAQNGKCYAYYETLNSYGYDPSILTNYITTATITQSGIITSSSTPTLRSVGLASKAFIVNQGIYFLSTYQSTYQPTYFLVEAAQSTTAQSVVVAKLAYQNGGGYASSGLPNVSVLNNNVCYTPYLIKDLISAVNKGTALVSGTQTAGIYSQTGINLAFFTIGTTNIQTAEIGKNLLISGGFLWSYDGYLPVEQNFFLYPDNIEASSASSASGGNLSAQTYYYQATYEWTDNQGNAYRSAPSIPTSAIATSGTSLNVINVPTLRLTYKIPNPVKIVLYRWSTGQQVYYQVTSLTSPIINSTSADYISYTDTSSDATILGNNIIYTNGGVVEDINGPASSIFTLFDTRFWEVDSEDQNLLWYSKQVIEAVPVEMSDLFTFYIAPTQASEGSTGPITALFPMDDKLIIFKENAIYYINGVGPDNTGANQQYSQPIFVTSAVGCSNTQSIVLQPQGLMFQSEKGIWILSRNLETQYIGAGVEAFNSSVVESAISVPETNQLRFTLNTGETLMYDYYYGQWGTFVGAPGISSTLFQNLHTYLSAEGSAFQETPNFYLDGSNPVLINLTTAWFNLMGLQGYQRAYFFYLLGRFLTPHKLQVGVAYDYNTGPEQSSLITPTNFSYPLGSSSAQTPLGQGNPYGGGTDIEQWRIFLKKQRCQAFQISIQEVYDPSYNIPAGAGLTLSGINLVWGGKKGFRPIASKNSIGGGTK